MRLRACVLAGVVLWAVALGAVAGSRALDRAWPPPLPDAATVSAEVVDRDGRLLRAFAAEDGRWRLPVRLDEVDPRLVAMLIGYEDKRFYSHHGIDARAIARAGWQWLSHGRIVSGGSTLSMQVARLIEPREQRSVTAKLRQMTRAIQIERRLTKRQILELYLTLAPYGGNLEGVRAAALAWFGREPARLSVAEAALLVALPQLPERRRPDRFPAAARAARDRVLARLAEAGVIAAQEVARAAARPVPGARQALPALAAHLAATARRLRPDAQRQTTTIAAPVQQALEQVAAEAAKRLGPGLSVALLLADAGSGEILAQVGSAGAFDAGRDGWIDMTEVPRSPGSTLKPFIYALAIEDGLVMPETVIEDRPASFDGYRPRNFDMAYQGDVTVSAALQGSLNVPAVRLLQATGPLRLLARLRRAKARPVLPAGEPAGLAIGLGGLGISLHDLVGAYTAFPGRGRAVRLGNGITGAPGGPAGTVFEPVAAWHVSDILKGTPGPRDTARLAIAYKTGTSYGYRDAWSVGFDGRHVLGVWVGRPDSAAVPGLTGITAAAPILFEAFARSGLALEPLPPAPAGAVRLSQQQLPVPLRRFAGADDALPPVGTREAPPVIVYPPDGARVDLGIAGQARVQPLMVKLQGGRAPFRLIANGAPVAETWRSRSGQWAAAGAGFSRLTVIDALGRSASVSVFLE